jgi:hypothetical protein
MVLSAPAHVCLLLLRPAASPRSATKGKQRHGAKSSQRATPATFDFDADGLFMDDPNQEVPSGVLVMEKVAAAAGAKLAVVLAQELWRCLAQALLLLQCRRCTNKSPRPPAQHAEHLGVTATSSRGIASQHTRVLCSACMLLACPAGFSSPPPTSQRPKPKAKRRVPPAPFAFETHDLHKDALQDAQGIDAAAAAGAQLQLCLSAGNGRRLWSCTAACCCQKKRH